MLYIAQGQKLPNFILNYLADGWRCPHSGGPRSFLDHRWPKSPPAFGGHEVKFAKHVLREAAEMC